MDWLTPELMKFAGHALIVGGAIYGGIRADLRHMHERIRSALDAAQHAHERLDRHLEDHR